MAQHFKASFSKDAYGKHLWFLRHRATKEWPWSLVHLVSCLVHLLHPALQRKLNTSHICFVWDHFKHSSGTVNYASFATLHPWMTPPCLGEGQANSTATLRQKNYVWKGVPNIVQFLLIMMIQLSTMHHHHHHHTSVSHESNMKRHSYIYVLFITSKTDMSVAQSFQDPESPGLLAGLPHSNLW